MTWLIYFIVSAGITLIFVPVRHWLRLWPAGFAGILLLYLIDSTLVGLGAYSYSHGLSILSGLPVLYLLSGYPQGIFLAYFYPEKRFRQLPYVMLMAAGLLVLEIITLFTGDFAHHQWNLARSYLLDVFGLTVLSTLSRWFGGIGKEKA